MDPNAQPQQPFSPNNNPQPAGPPPQQYQQPQAGYGGQPAYGAPQPGYGPAPQAQQPNPGYGVPQPPLTPPYQKTNSMAITGFVLAFLMPLLGLILSIVGLRQVKKRGEGGKTLAVAGIIVSAVTIAIATLIIALVFIAVPSISKQARDTERQSDINTIFVELESYFEDQRRYPTLDELNDSAWRSDNVPALYNEALVDPNGTITELTGSPNPYTYSYQPTDASGKPCNNTTVPCTKYSLTSTLEDGTVYEKRDLNSF